MAKKAFDMAKALSDAREPAAKEATPAEPGSPSAKPAAPKAAPRAAARKIPATTDTSPAPQAHYLDFTVKSARLRPDQISALTDLRVQLNRRRAASEGERITENTLIRVAVDFLFDPANRDRLTGATEAELLASLRTN